MNIIELAKEAGWTESTWEGFLTKFAALVRVEALEEAAQFFEGNEDDVGYAIATEIRGIK